MRSNTYVYDEEDNEQDYSDIVSHDFSNNDDDEDESEDYDDDDGGCSRGCRCQDENYAAFMFHMMMRDLFEQNMFFH